MSTRLECFYCFESDADLVRCDECQNLFCSDCEAYREDDAPVSLCMSCGAADEYERETHRQFANRIDAAIAYCDRILSMNPNGAELMFLGEVKRILQGLSDGRAEGG